MKRRWRFSVRKQECSSFFHLKKLFDLKAELIVFVFSFLYFYYFTIQRALHDSLPFVLESQSRCSFGVFFVLVIMSFVLSKGFIELEVVGAPSTFFIAYFLK